MAHVIIQNDRYRLEVVPDLGAGVADWSVKSPLGDWTPLVRRAPSDVRDPEHLGLFLMGPWTNRIRQSRFTWKNRQHTLHSNHNDGTAIHGIVRDAPFRIRHRSPVSALFELHERKPLNWPWPLDATVRYELFPDALEIELCCTNRSDELVPMGVGLHPYFMRRLWNDHDQLRVRLPATGRYPCEHCIPTADAQPDTRSARLRTGDVLLDEPLDDVFRIDAAQTDITWTASRIKLRIESSTSARHAVVYAPSIDRGPASWFCLEPTTMVNDGFNLLARGLPDTGVQTIKPGESASITTSFIVEHLAGDSA